MLVKEKKCSFEKSLAQNCECSTLNNGVSVKG